MLGSMHGGGQTPCSSYWLQSSVEKVRRGARRSSRPSALTRTDPLSLMKADPLDARLLVNERGGATSGSGARRWSALAVSLFGARAVSSPRPAFPTATRAALVKRGAEQPGATRSAL
jgi:hypothetical protein